MNYFMKPVLLAGLGLFTLGTLPSADAKEPVKLGVSIGEDRTDGHWETRIEYETRYDSWGRPYTVAVERRVWVDDGPSVGFYFGFGHRDHHHHHHDNHHGSNYYHHRSR